MASAKQRRKQAKRAAQKPRPAGPFRHPDGDRRRRDAGLTARQAVAQKRALQQFPGVILPAETPGGGTDPTPGRAEEKGERSF